METPSRRLYITRFNSANSSEHRQEELDLCLKLNEAAFDYVYVLSENVEQPSWSKARWTLEGKRHLMSDAFELMRSVSGLNDVNVVANSDLIIPKDSLTLIGNTLADNEVYCLSKRDITPKGIRPWITGWSQDVWCFRGKPNLNGVGNYYFGLPGCDNRLAFELREAGLVVRNPAHSIPTYHLHLSSVRTATNDESNRVPAPYMLVTPHRLGEGAELQVVPTHSSNRNHFNALW